MAALYTTECAFQYRETSNSVHLGPVLQAIGSIFSPLIHESIRICYTEVDEQKSELSMSCIYVSPDMPQICGKQYLSQIDTQALLQELKTGKVICIENTLTNPLMNGKEQIYLAAGIRSELLYPILADNRIVYVFSLHRNDIHAWTEQEITAFANAALNLHFHVKPYECIAFHSHLMDCINEAIAVIRSQGRIAFWNAAAERMFGYTATEAIDRGFAELLKLDKTIPAYSQAIDGLTSGKNGSCILEILCRHKNGQIIFAEIFVRVFRNENGKFFEAIVSLHDITGRRSMEAALKKQTDSLLQRNHLLDLSNEAILIWELGGKITYWNKGAELIYGYTKEEAIGQESWALLNTTVPTQNAHLETLLNKDGLYCGEIEQTTKDGITLIIETNQQVMLDAHEKKLVLEINRNITERKLAEKTIKRQNTILTYIKLIHEQSSACQTFDELSLACLHILEDATGSKISFLSETGEEGTVRNIALNHASQYSSEHTWAGDQLSQSSLIHSLHGSVILKDKTIMTNNSVVIPGTQYLPSSHPNILRFIGVPYSLNNKIRGVAAVANKETDYIEEDLEILEALTPVIMESIQRKRTEEALHQSEQHALSLVEELKNIDTKKNIFLSTLSHELRNPLSTMTASIHLLDSAPEGKCNENTKVVMKRQLKQLCCLADDLLDYTRIQNNKMNLKKIKTDLRDLIIHIVEDYQTLFSEKGFQLVKDIQIGILYLNLDPIRLTQLVGNLLDNALKHSCKNGTVFVTLSKTSSEAVICVKDNGVGIRPDMLPRLFQPFIQKEVTPDHNNSGLGLGLSIAIGIAQLHGGTITAYSDGIGTGATFSVHLPIESNKAHSDIPLRMEADIRILLIDDNLAYLQMLCGMLRHAGYSADFAVCGEDGLKKVSECIPNIVFCAARLPDMDSSHFAYKIRNEYSLSNVFLVALAGNKDQAALSYSIPDGFDTYLAMPADMQSIKKLINEIPSRDNTPH